VALHFFLDTKKPDTESAGTDGTIFLNGDGSGTLFLVHGLTGTPNEMKYLANFFNKKKGYTVICPRLANHGAPLPVLKKTQWREFYDSLRDSFLQARSEIKGPIFAAGLSMGALLSLLLAEEFPGQIAGVSCLSPTLFYDGWNVPWFSKIVLPLLYATPLKHVAYYKEEPPYGIKNKALQSRIHKYYNNARFQDQQGVAEYGYPYFPMSLLHQLRKLIAHLIERLPAIQAPVQLIQAREDDLTSVRNSRFIYENIGSRHKEIVMLDDCYHVITADQERGTVARNMDTFFSNIMAAAATATVKESSHDPIPAECVAAAR
jgi:carboxylesterase